MTDMTTPERGLFERIKHECFSPGSERYMRCQENRLEQICTEFEQRLAENEARVSAVLLEAAATVGAKDLRITEFEQRLAEAEQEVRSCQKDRVDLEVSFCKSSVEKNEEIAQLRARCGELEELIRDCNQSTSLLYGDFTLCDCVDNNGAPYPSQYLADLLAQPAQEQKG